jgi:hypothetical protein
MYVTPIGLVLIPASLVIFFFRPDSLGPWAIVVSAFQAASVVNIDGGFPIGVTPYFFVLILIATRFLPLWLSNKCGFGRSDIAIGMTKPLLILTVWAIASAFLLPWLFAGVGVDTPRGGMDSPETTPLRWSMSNAAQAGYVTLDAIFVLYLLWHSRISGYFERLIRALVADGLIAASIGAYQYVAHYSGLPYPKDFFNSNPGWRQLVNQVLPGVWRLNATFSEPSAAGAFFAVWSTLLLFLATKDRTSGKWAWPLFMMGVVMVFLTTSTTGYLAGGFVIALYIWKEFTRIFVTGKISPRILFSFLVMAGAVGAAFVFIPNFHDMLAKILWQKGQSQSSHDRTATIWEALRITSETYGMGAGLGSNRPSGMLFYVASNLGIPGLLLFTLTVGAVYQALRLALRSSSTTARAPAYLGAMGWAAAIELITMASAGGDMSGSLMWVCIGIAATGSRAVWLSIQSVPTPIELPESCRIRSVGELVILHEEYCVS